MDANAAKDERRERKGRKSGSLGRPEKAKGGLSGKPCRIRIGLTGRQWSVSHTHPATPHHHRSFYPTSASHPVSVPSRHLPAQACAPSMARLRCLTCFRDDADPEAEAERAQPLHSRRRGEGPSGREGGGARRTHLYSPASCCWKERTVFARRKRRSVRPPAPKQSGRAVGGGGVWGWGENGSAPLPFPFPPLCCRCQRALLPGRLSQLRNSASGICPGKVPSRV